MRHKQVLIIGEFEAGLEAHTALQDAAGDAADNLTAVVNTRWLGADELAVRPGAAAEADGVLLAPRSSRPHRVLPEPILAALRIARERKTPFLSVGDAHELVLIEVARNVLGMEKANSTFYDDEAGEPVVKELPRPYRPLTNRRPTLLDVAVRQDPILSDFLPPGRREEAARLTHGLNPDYGFALEEAGLRVAGVDAVDGRPCLWRLEGAPWHVTAAFLPQLGGRPGAPHPLIRGFVSHVAARR